MAPPFQVAEFDIMFDEGISRSGNILDLASEMNIVDKKGAWFSYKGQRLGQGRDSVREDLKKNPKLLDELEALVLQDIKEKQGKQVLKSCEDLIADQVIEAATT